MTFSTWSQTAASNTSVGGISTDGTVTLVKQIDNMFRGMMAELAVARDDGTIEATAVRGYLHGLTLSNNAGDATNDIDIALGECAASDSPYWKMALASTLTKRLDAAWAVGTNQGGLDTGSIANTWYFIWLIARSDTGVVDALFSTSPTAPTMPANYDRKRRIGAIIRVAAAIRGFIQDGDQFMWLTPSADVSAVNPGTSAVTRTLSAPVGLRVKAILNVGFSATTAADAPGAIYITDLSQTDIAANTASSASFSSFHTAAGSSSGSGRIEVMTNTSSQVRSRLQISAAGTTLFMMTHGWIDTRGRLA